MWLINTETLNLEEVANPENHRYAILSHTWEKEELTFQEMMHPGPDTCEKAGYRKISKTCQIAREKGYGYAWVDTCCIDKTSSAALSEAINSMFRWYRDSAVCFCYLSDFICDSTFEVDQKETADLLKKCKWFTRGWTLQELIAPEVLEFYDEDWNRRGTKEFFRHDISNITGIDLEVLENSELLSTFPIGRRMSWAAHRQTTRIEDQAYCLFGIFGVNMPMIYGEGTNAFIRLQEEIAKNTNDLTLFAWTSQVRSRVDERPTYRGHSGEDIRGILARSPQEFADCRNLKVFRDRITPPKEFAMTNNGLRIETCLARGPNKEYILALDCTDGRYDENRSRYRMGIHLIQTEANFVRSVPDKLFSTSKKDFWAGPNKIIYVRKDLTVNQAVRLKQQLQCCLIFHFQGSEGYKTRNFSAGPLSLWDQNGKRFFTGNRQNFTAWVEFTLQPRYWRFVIVCGLINEEEKNPELTGDMWDEYGGNLPWMVMFTDADANSRSQLAIIDDLKKQGGESSLIRLRKQVLKWHLDAEGRLPLREMSERLKFASDEDGEVKYQMSMVREYKEGMPLFHIRVGIYDINRLSHQPAEDHAEPPRPLGRVPRPVPNAPQAVPDYDQQGNSRRQRPNPAYYAVPQEAPGVGRVPLRPHYGGAPPYMSPPYPSPPLDPFGTPSPGYGRSPGPSPQSPPDPWANPFMPSNNSAFRGEDPWRYRA